jgi:hypothetical protein
VQLKFVFLFEAGLADVIGAFVIGLLFIALDNLQALRFDPWAVTKFCPSDRPICRETSADRIFSKLV